jgi:hypothetical protein
VDAPAGAMPEVDQDTHRFSLPWACCNFKPQPATLKGCQCAWRDALPGLGIYNRQK